MRDELQELVDRVAGLLGAPATLEDADFTLLAFCAHPVDGAETPVMDAVRTRSILGRGSTPETRRRFEDFGIAVAEGPLRTPGDPAAGILTRLVLPVRHAGRTRGYLWLLDGGRTDPDDDADPALAAALLPAERRLGAAIKQTVDTIFESFSGADHYAAVREMLLTSMRGVALTYGFDPRDPSTDPHLEQWKQLARALLMPADS